MADKKYWIAEVRLPIQINDASSPEEAAMKAARQLEHQYGINISNWYWRVFEYGGEEDSIGVVTEWFSNPSGSNFRKVDQNIGRHEELIKNEGNTEQVS